MRYWANHLVGGRMWCRTARRIALAALFTGSACSHWQAQQVSPDEGFAARTPPAIRLTLTDSSHVWLDHPVVTDSTFEGLSSDTVARVPRARVATWSVQRPGASSGVKVAAAGLGLAALIYLVTWKPFGD
jgi:hypothetical protein